MECSICCFEFTEKKHKKVTCISCKGDVCIKCFKTFLLTNAGQKCVLCEEDISLEFINIQTGSSFRAKYKQKLLEKLIADEESLLEETQIRMTLEKHTKMLDARLKVLTSHVKRFPDDDVMVEILSKTKSELQKRKGSANIEEPEKRQVTFPCPEAECNGFVCEGKCGMCKLAACVRCREPKTENHKCDPETVSTLKELAASTRPCPKCKIRIFKINGCDQMFCVKCTTAFSWRTGKIETRNIHNPHYFEWRRSISANGEIPRQPLDNVCLEEALNKIQNKNTRDRFNVLTHEALALSEAIGLKLSDASINRMRERYRREFLTCKLANAKKSWKMKLARQHSSSCILRDLLMIIDMFGPAVQDIVNNCPPESVDKRLKEFIEYVNEQFAETSARHDSKTRALVGYNFHVPTTYTGVL